MKREDNAYKPDRPNVGLANDESSPKGKYV